LKERIIKSKYFIPLSYSLFFIFVFLISLIYSFPVELIEPRIVSEIETNTPYRLEIDDLSLSPVISLKAKQVKIYTDNKLFLNFNDMRVSTTLFSLFFNNKRFPFKARFMDGYLKGDLVYNFERGQIVRAKVRLTDVNIGESSDALMAYLGMNQNDLQGLLNGNINIDLSSDTKGDFDFWVDTLNIKNIKLLGATMPGFNNLESTFKGRIEQGITRVEELRFKNKDFDLNLSGTMPLLWENSKGGKIDLMVNLKVISKEAKYGLVKSLLAPQRDGTLGGKILGTIENPRVVSGAMSPRRQPF